MADSPSTTPGHGADDGDVQVHPHPLSMYLGVFGVLVLLTLLTVGVYQVHLGAANLVVAVIISTIKASLVVLFFMHLREDAKFNALVFVGSLLFAGVFLAYTVNDTGFRGDVDGVSGLRYDAARGEWAAGTAPALIEETEALETAARSKAGGEATSEPAAGAPAPPSPGQTPASDDAAEASPDDEG